MALLIRNKMTSVSTKGETGNWLNQYCPRNGVSCLYPNYMKMQVSHTFK